MHPRSPMRVRAWVEPFKGSSTPLGGCFANGDFCLLPKDLPMEESTRDDQLPVPEVQSGPQMALEHGTCQGMVGGRQGEYISGSACM